MIRIDIDDRELQQALAALADHAQNLRPVMRRIAGVMHDAVEQNFEAEGRPDAWATLKPSTIRQRERKGYWPGKILQRTGGLAASISEYYDDSQAMVGTNKEYGPYLQLGTSEMEARPFLTLTDEDLGDIIDLIGDHLQL